ncbi:MAG: PEP-CTERM sorting domain-containing protein [Thiohalorhabdus sp.]|uniref:PEP-CTERM sorting domain-containing protein n=1 Tax=Thiohalorhabdus sp. TaxID=3094134 RepID=UPI003981115C
MPSDMALWTDDSGENFYRNGERVEGAIQEGDTLRGAMDITKLENGGDASYVNTTGRQFTSLFQVEVADMGDSGKTADLGGSTYEMWDIRFRNPSAEAWDPYLGDSEADSLGIDKDQLSTLFFDDSIDAGTEFDRTAGDSEQELADASDGSLRAAAGLDGEDDFWIAQSPIELQAFQDAVMNEDVGDFFFGASWVYEDFDRDFGEFSQNLGSNAIQDIAFSGDGAADVGLYGDGDLFGPTESSGFDAFNKVNITVAGGGEQIPEPATAALTGLGLVLTAAFGRRRFPGRSLA